MKALGLALVLAAGAGHAQKRDVAQTTMLAVDTAAMTAGLVSGFFAAQSASGSKWRAASLLVGLLNLSLSGASLYVALTSDFYSVRSIPDPALLAVGAVQFVLGVANLALPFVGLQRVGKGVVVPLVLRGKAGGRPWTGLGVEVAL